MRPENGIIKKTLKKQYNLEDAYQFGTILTKRDLPSTGFYTGYIRVEDRTSSNLKNDGTETVEIVPVSINLEPAPLHIESEFFVTKGKRFRKTALDLIAELYGYLFVSPRFARRDANGNLCITYTEKQDNDRYLIFKGLDGGPLPGGATFTVMQTEGEGVHPSAPMPINRFFRKPLIPTDNAGMDIGTGAQITTDGRPASFAILHGLPQGKYLAWAEYVDGGEAMRTNEQYFEILDC
jgi:hypothetical protein